MELGLSLDQHQLRCGRVEYRPPLRKLRQVPGLVAGAAAGSSVTPASTRRGVDFDHCRQLSHVAIEISVADVKLF
jgi:hypothetical protein